MRTNLSIRFTINPSRFLIISTEIPSFLRPNLPQFRNGESQWTLSAMKPLCKALKTELFAEVLTALRSHSTNVPSFCKVTEQSCLKTLFTEVCLSSCRKSSAFQQNSFPHGVVRINSLKRMLTDFSLPKAGELFLQEQKEPPKTFATPLTQTA